MYYVYKITAVVEGGEKEYIGATSDLVTRMRAHKTSARFKGSERFSYEVLLVTEKIHECLEREWKEIDKALGGVGEDGHREHFEGKCLNRSVASSLPLSGHKHLCYTKGKGFYIK